MENTGVCSSRNTTKTDLSLLLECLKFQMKSPDSQKQALLTINSICENREDHVDLFRELGGVTFVYNLSKSNVVHLEVKEAALFTLGTLAECNESGQTLAQTTGCLDILLDLFRPANRPGDEKEQEDIDVSRPGESHRQLHQSAGFPLKTIHSQKPACVSSDCDAGLQPDRSEKDYKMNNATLKTLSQEELTKTSKKPVMCSVCKTAGVSLPSNGRSLEGDSEPQNANSLIFEPVLSKKQKKGAEIKRTDEFQSREIREVQKPPAEEPSFFQMRCAGCVVPFEKVTSRNFASLQSFCHSSCDLHRVLKEATERFRKARLNQVFMKEHQDVQNQLTNRSSVRVAAAQSPKNPQNRVSLTPLHRGDLKKTFAFPSRADPRLTPLKRLHAPEDRRPVSHLGITRDHYA